MISLAQVFPCFGISALGVCSYNPAQPALTYFSIGDAIAALGFTLAIQQLFKPIYLFRLRAYGLRIIHLSFAVFLGALCAVVAATLPNLPIAHEGPLEYPVVWEIFGALLIGIAYGVAAFISLTPARLYTFNLIAFVRAASALLSAANDDDRVNLAEDLLRGRNIERLIRYASAWQMAEMHEASVEFERLREIGAPQAITGSPPASAFYRFSHRRQLQAASVAGTFLQILSDPAFCSALVRKCAWLTAAMLDSLAEKNLYADPARPFIQEIGSQAILNDESMIAREIGYTGFGAVPLLSTSLFGRWFILQHYNPLAHVDFRMPKVPAEGIVARLNGASKMILETAIKGREWYPTYVFSVQNAYEHLFRQWSYTRPKSLPVEYAVTLHLGIADLYKMTLSGLGKLAWDQKKALFAVNRSTMRTDLVDAISSIVYESLTCIANGFTGYDDDAWIHAIGIFQDIYPTTDNAPAGMNPLQQQLAIKLLDKLRQNMEGLYPAISRVLLAVIGPYDGHPKITKRTAHVILKDAVYKEFQKLALLRAEKPEKLADFLPSNVTYDPNTNTLTHAFRFGSKQVTALSALTIPSIDLANETNWQTPAA